MSNTPSGWEHLDSNPQLTDKFGLTGAGSFTLPEIRTLFYTRLLRIRRWDDIIPRFRITWQWHPFRPRRDLLPRLDLDIWRWDITLYWVPDWRDDATIDWRGRPKQHPSDSGERETE